jgi:hypothetical protein
MVKLISLKGFMTINTIKSRGIPHQVCGGCLLKEMTTFNGEQTGCYLDPTLNFTGTVVVSNFPAHSLLSFSFFMNQSHNRARIAMQLLTITTAAE